MEIIEKPDVFLRDAPDLLLYVGGPILALAGLYLFFVGLTLIGAYGWLDLVGTVLRFISIPLAIVCMAIAIYPNTKKDVDIAYTKELHQENIHAYYEEETRLFVTDMKELNKKNDNSNIRQYSVTLSNNTNERLHVENNVVTIERSKRLDNIKHPQTVNNTLKEE